MRLVKIVLLGLFFSGVSYAGPVKVQELNSQVFQQSKPAVTVTVDKPEFVIKLKSNPTTGFSWFLKDYDAGLIEAVGHKYYPSGNKNLIGAPGFELWSFKVKPAAFTVPHELEIKFVYVRPWESAAKPTEAVFSVTTTQK